MDRREFLASSIALAFASVLHGPARAEPGSEAARARALYEAIFERLLVAAPQTATSLGLDTGRHAAARSRLDDRSPAGRMNVLGPLIEAWPQLQSIDAGRLEGRDRSDFETIAWVAAISREIASHPFGGIDSYAYPVPYVVSQLTGAYQSTPDFIATKQAPTSRRPISLRPSTRSNRPPMPRPIWRGWTPSRAKSATTPAGRAMT